MRYELTAKDIDNYLATKAGSDVIGRCMNGAECLAHNTLKHKYGLETFALSMCAEVYEPSGECHIVSYPEDVENLVHIFDTLKIEEYPVTKNEFTAACKEESHD